MIRPLLLAATAVATLGAADPVALARQEAKQAEARSRQLTDRAAQAKDEAARLRARNEALAARIEEAEARISASEAELRAIGALRERQRARLAERQQPLIHLTAALQTMARRPAALALVEPGTVDDYVRTRALLASTLPRMRARTADLRAEIERARRLDGRTRETAAALAAERASLRQRRVELAQAEANEIRRSGVLARSALVESDRSIAFDEEARALADEAARRRFEERIAAGLAALPAPPLRPGSAGKAGPAPAYLLPAQGRVLGGTGEISDAGVHARGINLEVTRGAQVVAPRGGTVAYAARFRSYGEVVVIDHGGGWTTTLTRLSTLAVRRGDRIAAGAPVGRAGEGNLGIELRKGSEPRPIAALLMPR